MSWLTLLTLQTLRLVALLEQTGLLLQTGLKWTLTTFTLLAGLRWYKRDSLTLDKIGGQTLDNGRKSGSFNEKEILDWTFCLVISLYDVLLLVEERLIWLYHEDIVNDIGLASLTLSCLMRWSKSL